MRTYQIFILGILTSICFHSCTIDNNGLYTITDARSNNTFGGSNEIGNKLLGKKVNIIFYDTSAKIEINDHEQVALFKGTGDSYSGTAQGEFGTDTYKLTVLSQSYSETKVQIDIVAKTKPQTISYMGQPMFSDSEGFKVLAQKD